MAILDFLRWHSRVWMTTAIIQLTDRLGFICIWAYLCFAPNGFMKMNLLGHGSWLDLVFCVVLTLLRVIFLIQAAWHRRSIPSAPWFEVCWNCLTIGIDTVFIVRLAKGMPSVNDFHNARIIPPFDKISLALNYLGITCLSVDALVSIALCLILLNAALRPKESEGWRVCVHDLVKGKKCEHFEADAKDIPIYTLEDAKQLLTRFRNFLLSYTLLRFYRRDDQVEPIWLAGLRGTLAIAAITGIELYGIFFIFILPIWQFKDPLPRNAIPAPMPYETGFANHVYGVVWLKRFEFQAPFQEPYWSDPVGAYSNDTGSSDFLDWFHASASAGSTQFSCSYGVYSLWDRRTYASMDFGMQWSCQGLRNNLANLGPTNGSVPPVIQLSWSGPPSATPILRSYVASMPIWENNRPWMESFGKDLLWNISTGTSTSLNVGKNVIHARSGTFLEMFGIKKGPLEIVGYPVGAATFSSAEPTAQTTIQIIPSFGGFFDNHVQAWEESIEYTMLGGLTAAGGLFSALDVAFVLLFGKSLVGLFFGGKPLSPFGLVAQIRRKTLQKKLVDKYPGLDPEEPDHSKRSKSVCDFLLDFVLDIGSLQRTSNNKSNTADKSTASNTQHARRDTSATAFDSESPIEEKKYFDLQEDPTGVRSSPA